MLKRFFALLLAVGLSGALFAADADLNSDGKGRRSRNGRQTRERGSRRGRRGGQQGFGGSMFARFKAEEEIKNKFPKEYAEAEKQLFEAEAKLRELAKKAKVDLPETTASKLRVLKHKQPGDFSRIISEQDGRKAFGDMMKLAGENGVELMPQGMRGRHPGMRGEREDGPRGSEMREGGERQRRSGRVDFNKLRKLYPEEMKKLDELRRSDPEAFRKGLRELNDKMKKDTVKAE